MLPLSLPALATLAIIDMLATWNEFLIALVLISGQASRTVPVGLLQFQGEFSSQYTLLMAGVADLDRAGAGDLHLPAALLRRRADRRA